MLSGDAVAHDKGKSRNALVSVNPVVAQLQQCSRETLTDMVPCFDFCERVGRVKERVAEGM